MMDVVVCAQGSDEWKAARCGSLGASSIADMMARTKSGWSASRANLAARLISERLTGVPQETYQNAAMQFGIEQEPAARAIYEFLHDVEVATVGIVRHPTILFTHASPDGLVGDDGLIEIKCPLTATHIDTLLSETIDGRYVKQMQWQMACTGRSWCDYVSFDPRLPAEMQIFVKRVERDDAMIAEIEREARIFLAEIEATISQLGKKYPPPSAAAA